MLVAATWKIHLKMSKPNQLHRKTLQVSHDPRSTLQDNSTEEHSTQIEAGGKHHPAVLLSATLVPHLWHVNWKAPELELSWLERQILLYIMPSVPRATVCRLLFENFASRVVCTSSLRSLADLADCTKVI